jgi:ABC-type transporter Mla MlaB component
MGGLGAAGQAGQTGGAGWVEVDLARIQLVDGACMALSVGRA